MKTRIIVSTKYHVYLWDSHRSGILLLMPTVKIRTVTSQIKAESSKFGWVGIIKVPSEDTS